MIEAIIFDLGRVLVDVDITVGIVGKLADSLRADSPGLQAVMDDPIMRDFDCGLIEPRQFYEKLCQKLDLTMQYDDFVEQWCCHFSEIAGMERLSASLADRIKLGLLSDTDVLHWDYIKNKFPVVKYFPDPTLSFITGFMKPDSRSYLTACEKLQIPPHNCLYIDDLANNVAGAANVGMHALRFVDCPTLTRQLTDRGVLPD